MTEGLTKFFDAQIYKHDFSSGFEVLTQEVHRLLPGWKFSEVRLPGNRIARFWEGDGEVIELSYKDDRDKREKETR